MKVVPVPCLEDNYAYLLIDEATNTCAVVDPVQPAKLIAAAEAAGNPQITAILTTHHHFDHAGGNEEFLKLVPGIKVYGSDDRIPGMNEKTEHGQKFKIGQMELTALHTPCHTTGHVCYNVADGAEKAVFTGDTLFIGGCGKFFEGTPAQMYKNLVEILGVLPEDTKVWCGHEYTKSNLTFCSSIEPANEAISRRLSAINANPTAQTIPSTIGDEWKWNVFMRVGREKSVRKVVGETGGVEAMGKLREWKNNGTKPTL